MSVALETTVDWIDVCSTSDLVADSGICALIKHQQIAIFYVPGGATDTSHHAVYALSNFDPVGKANVLYRGLIGSSQGELFVASPLYKQRYSLTSGKCLDDQSITVQALQTKIHDDRVYIAFT